MEFKRNKKTKTLTAAEKMTSNLGFKKVEEQI